MFPMIFRVASYVSLAALIVGLAIYFNREDGKGGFRIDVNPEQALDCGPHRHEFLGPGCECDPELEIKQAIADRKDYSSTHAELGEGFYARGRYDFAKSCYGRALELDGGNGQARYGLGLSYAKLGEWSKARQELERAIEADRKFVPAYISLAVLDYAEGNYSVAKERLQGVLRIDPSNKYAKKLMKSLPHVRKYATEIAGASSG